MLLPMKAVTSFGQQEVSSSIWLSRFALKHLVPDLVTEIRLLHLPGNTIQNVVMNLRQCWLSICWDVVTIGSLGCNFLLFYFSDFNTIVSIIRHQRDSDVGNLTTCQLSPSTPSCPRSDVLFYHDVRNIINRNEGGR